MRENRRTRTLGHAGPRMTLRLRFAEEINNMTRTMDHNTARAWLERYDPLAPKAGDAAPDFELHDVNADNPVRVSDFTGKKPVALVFGSFT